MSTMSNMKKFGRGYVLDFTALMNEVRSPNQKPPDDTTTRGTSTTTSPTTPATSFDVSDGSVHSPTSDRDFGDNQHASGADTTPSPTDDDPSGEASQGMKRRAARMSVSRTGRLKNRDRQRISVLETAEFYGVKPDAAPPLPVRGNHAGHPTTVRDASGRKASADAAVGLPSETLADFDGVIAALDSSVPTQRVKADCYSF